MSIILLALLTSCATSHLRFAENIEDNQIKEVLILDPEIDSSVKYIDIPRYFKNNSAQKKVQKYAIAGYKKALGEKGYKSYKEEDLAKTSLYDSYSKKIKTKLRNLGHQIISDDLEHVNDKMPSSYLKKISIPLPEEWKKFDAVIFIYGKAKIETNRESCTRWRGNIIYNILALPLSVTTLVFPFLAPIAFVGSGDYVFAKSPDETFLNMVIIDVRSRKIIYQYDYFIKEWGFSEDAFSEITEDALSDFPERE